MRVNKDDLYQIPGTDVDRPPDNYTFDLHIKYVNGGRSVKVKEPEGSKVAPENESESSVLVPRPSDHSIADPHYVGGLKGNGQKHGRTRPKQTLKYFEEVRVIIYDSDLSHRRKESLWVTNDLIVMNKATHKAEKQKMMKLKERDEAAALETVTEDGDDNEEKKDGEKKENEKKPERIPIAERVRIANKAHRKEMKENPLPKARFSIKK
jgi:hypothetical protein